MPSIASPISISRLSSPSNLFRTRNQNDLCAYDEYIHLSASLPHETYHHELPAQRRPTIWEESNEPGTGQCETETETRYAAWRRRSERFIEERGAMFWGPREFGWEGRCPYALPASVSPLFTPNAQAGGELLEENEMVHGDVDERESGASTPSMNGRSSSPSSSISVSLSSPPSTTSSQPTPPAGQESPCYHGVFDGKYLGGICHHFLRSILLESDAGQSRSRDPEGWLGFLREEQERWTPARFVERDEHLEVTDAVTELFTLCGFLVRKEEARWNKKEEAIEVETGEMQ